MSDSVADRRPLARDHTITSVPFSTASRVRGAVVSRPIHPDTAATVTGSGDCDADNDWRRGVTLYGEPLREAIRSIRPCLLAHPFVRPLVRCPLPSRITAPRVTSVFASR
ncbi:hypothetical protein [Halalkalicoccus salilacus]|uniref:hypothetical protein n=1 Tax=Halalkalicoccus sp. GCM10025704 TaxID=3252662 RepID=UPI00360B3D35